MKRFIGIDIHSQECIFAIIDTEGKTMTSGEFKSDEKEIISFITKNKINQEDEIGLESCGFAFNIATCLMENCEAKVSVYKAEEARKYARKAKRKTDLIDAHVIADAMRTGKFESSVYVPPKHVETLRFLIHRRARAVRLRTSCINSAKFVINIQVKNALSAKKLSLSHEKGWLVARNHPSLNPSERRELEWEYMQWKTCNEHVESIEKEIADLVEKHFSEQVRLITTIPGVGFITAAAMMAAIGNISRFDTPEQLVSYLGLDPGVWESGKTETKGRPITKNGSKYHRSLLIQCAQHHRRPINELYPYFIKGVVNGSPKKGLVNVAHKIVRIIWALLKKRQEFNPEYLNVKQKITKPAKKYVLNKDEM